MEWGDIYDNSGNPQSQKIEEWIAAAGKIDTPDAHYIILAKELDWHNYAWLNDLQYLKLVKATPTLLVYEREN
jgi:hypothetical protein